MVDYAGDYRFEQGRIPDPSHPAYAGLPSTAKDFAPPDGRLFRTVAGTSYAAPRVANLAARLFREFPNASANLVRALIADSATVPDDRPRVLSGQHPWSDSILRVYGYGQPDFTRARWSADNEVLLLAEDTLQLDSFRLYTIPSLPDEFLSSEGRGCISVTLAFDPPTRHTRGDSYLGVSMEFALFRNVDAPAVADAIREWSKEERDGLEGSDLPSLERLAEARRYPVAVNLSPGVNKRKKGTLQRGMVHISSTRWQYDRSPLVLAVICQRKWAPEDITDQRYAVVASLRHQNPEVMLHSHVREYARIYQRARARV